MYIYLNNDFIEADKAVVHVSDLAIQRGYGIFDFFRVMDNVPLFLEDYIDRFYASAKTMRLDVPMEREAFKSTLFELIKKNNLPMSGIKVILTGGYSPDGFRISKPNLIIQQAAFLFPPDTVQPKGVKIITHEYVREMPTVKTINYLTGIWTLKKMEEQGAVDVLYQMRGEVTEFPRCNFFIVKQDGAVATPAKNILKGITRKHVLALAAKKFTVKEEIITLNDIAQAREAFMTSTTKRIIPIVQVDDKPVGDGKPGQITLTLLHDLIALEREEREKYKAVSA
ncbi:MAG: aminotransferase class IV [Cyclobacteriaceae bacterium]|nr:aminotransferase class IV [Cyclobacteriaceae bacterium]